jgi:hypothetical protein
MGQQSIEKLENSTGIQSRDFLKVTMPQYFDPQRVTQNQQLSKNEPLFTFDRSLKPEGSGQKLDLYK